MLDPRPLPQQAGDGLSVAEEVIAAQAVEIARLQRLGHSLVDANARLRTENATLRAEDGPWRKQGLYLSAELDRMVAENESLVALGNKMADEVKGRWSGATDCECECCAAARAWRAAVPAKTGFGPSDA